MRDQFAAISYFHARTYSAEGTNFYIRPKYCLLVDDGGFVNDVHKMFPTLLDESRFLKRGTGELYPDSIFASPMLYFFDSHIVARERLWGFQL